MIELTNINTQKSKETKRLIFKHNFLDYLDKICFIIFVSAFIFYGVLIEKEMSYDGLFSGFLIYFLAPFFIIAGFYSIYRKFNEDKLEFVENNSSKTKNIEIIKAFLQKYKYKISSEDDDLIIIIDEYLLSYNGLWRKKYLYIIDDSGIYFNVRKLYPIIAPPIYISHYTIKSDLKKFILNYGI